MRSRACGVIVTGGVVAVGTCELTDVALFFCVPAASWAALDPAPDILIPSSRARGAFNGVLCLLIKVIVGRTGVAAEPAIDGESVDP